MNKLSLTYLVAFILMTLSGVHAFEATGITAIDQVRISALETPTNGENAVHRQSILFSWIRHCINRGVDMTDMHDLGYVLAYWGEIKPEYYEHLDKSYATMEQIMDSPRFIEEIRGPESPEVTNPTDWAHFGGGPSQSGFTEDPGPTKGDIAWKFPTGHSWYVSATVEEGRVYITSPGMRTLMFCLDEATGEVIWTTYQDGLQMYSTPRGASTALLLDNHILMRATSGSWEYGDEAKHIYRINKKTGKVVGQIDANRVDYRRGTTSVTGNEDYVVFPYGRLDLKNKPATAIMQDTVQVRNRNGRSVWALRIGDLFGEILLDDDLIFAGSDDGVLYALNLEGNKRISWKVDLESPIRMRPAVSENIVVVGTEFGALYGLERETGEPLWEVQLNDGSDHAFQLFSNPLIHDSRIFIGSATDALYCVDLETGKVLWEVEASDWVRSQPFALGNRVFYASLDGRVTALKYSDKNARQLWITPVGQHELFADLSGSEAGILASSSDLYLYSLNPDTGAIQWKHSLLESTFEDDQRIMADIVAAGGDFQSPPTVSNGKVYVGTPSRFVFAVDAYSGERIWRFETSGQISGAPSVRDGKVYFGQQGGNEDMYAVNAETGEPVWTHTAGWVWTTCTPDDERVYSGTVDGNIFAVDVDSGVRIWTVPTNGGIYPAPAIDDKRVYTGSWDGHYLGIDKRTGEIDWASFGGFPDSAAGVLWRDMFIARTDGRMVGFDRETGEELWSFREERRERGRTNMNSTASNSGNYTFFSSSIDHDGAALGAALYCIDNRTGEYLWHYMGAGGWNGSSCTPDTVIAGSSTEAYIVCLDVEPNPDGSPKVIWRTRIGGVLKETIPAIYGSRAYLLGSDAYMYAFE